MYDWMEWWLFDVDEWDVMNDIPDDCGFNEVSMATKCRNPPSCLWASKLEFCVDKTVKGGPAEVQSRDEETTKDVNLGKVRRVIFLTWFCRSAKPLKTHEQKHCIRLVYLPYLRSLSSCSKIFFFSLRPQTSPPGEKWDGINEMEPMKWNNE